MRLLLATALFIGSLTSGSLYGDARAEMDQIMPLLADLAARSGYGNGHAEVAAFLVREADGTLRCQLWNHSAEFQRASHRGTIPQGTIAIAHTHPRCCRDLSIHDRREAERLGIPIIAVSMGTMHLVAADGIADSVRRGIRWSGHRESSRTCVLPSEPLTAGGTSPLSR